MSVIQFFQGKTPEKVGFELAEKLAGDYDVLPELYEMEKRGHFRDDENVPGVFITELEAVMNSIKANQFCINVNREKEHMTTEMARHLLAPPDQKPMSQKEILSDADKLMEFVTSVYKSVHEKLRLHKTYLRMKCPLHELGYEYKERGCNLLILIVTIFKYFEELFDIILANTPEE